MLAGQAGSSASRRYLLGPATITGTDIDRVKVRHAKKAYTVELDLTDSGSAAFDALAQSNVRQKVAVTLDASVLATAVPPDDAALVASSALSFTGAYNLASRYRQSEVEQLVGFANETTMTNAARHSLGEADPHLDDKAQFAVDCSFPEAAGSLVLGCYTRKTVYVLRVDRADLAPVMPVSTAHEMLHAAYLHLSPEERRRVNIMIEVFYATIDNPDLTDLVAQYERVEPGQRLNELHSLLPTEVRTLSPALERYYRRYFRDRSRVVDAFDSYNVVFASVRSRLNQLDGELTALKAQLDETKPRLEDAGTRAAQLGNQIGRAPRAGTDRRVQQSRGASEFCRVRGRRPRGRVQLPRRPVQRQARRDQHGVTGRARPVQLDQRGSARTQAGLTGGPSVLGRTRQLAGAGLEGMEKAEQQPLVRPQPARLCCLRWPPPFGEGPIVERRDDRRVDV